MNLGLPVKVTVANIASPISSGREGRYIPKPGILLASLFQHPVRTVRTPSGSIRSSLRDDSTKPK